MTRRGEVKRDTKETKIHAVVDCDNQGELEVSTELPFFDHMLTAMAFHGGFGLTVSASGDLDVDPHHVVEDTGIVIGTCLEKIFREAGPVQRFGHSVVPMDEALSEAVIDICGRPTLVYRADFPHPYAGEFALWLFREFFSGLAMGASIALHLECRYGENSHHMIEALFKALGKAIGRAYTPAPADRGGEMSTKGLV